MAPSFNRRIFFKRALALGATAAGIGAFELGRQGYEVLEQRRTWDEAALANPQFLNRYGAKLSRVRLGTSFAPEQFNRNRAGRIEALSALHFAVQDLRMNQIRLGLRWDGVTNGEDEIDLSYYKPYLDYALNSGISVCLNPGPIRVFRWPEEHIPQNVLARLEDVPATGAWLQPRGPLYQAAREHLERLLEALDREYGADLQHAVTMVQLENEPFYELGEHLWRFSPEYMQDLAFRLGDAFPDAELLVTTAGRLHLHIIRDLFLRLLAADSRFAGRLVSGFDFHYKTPLRDSYPIVRHMDQLTYARPFAPTTEEHIRDSRSIGFRIEVTEGQAEPYGYLTEPGNSAQDFRYLLLRLMDKVLDPQKHGLVRIWGVEELAKRFLRKEDTGEHRAIRDLIREINASRRDTTLV